jgi:hypothetical protein
MQHFSCHTVFSLECFENETNFPAEYGYALNISLLCKTAAEEYSGLPALPKKK